MKYEGGIAVHTGQSTQLEYRSFSHTENRCLKMDRLRFETGGY